MEMLPLWGHHCHGGHPASHWGHCHQRGHHHPRDIATMGLPPPRESCHYRDTAATMGNADTTGDTTARGMLPPQGTSLPWGCCHHRVTTPPGTLPPWGCPPPRGSCHHGDTTTAMGTGPPQSTTLLILLGPLEEGELAGVVDNGELAQEGVDDLAGAGVREDVQVLDGPLGQVEGRATLHPLGAGPRPPRLQGGDPLGGRHRDGAHQLQLHLDEAGVGAVLVLGDTGGGVSGARAGRRDPPRPCAIPIPGS